MNFNQNPALIAEIGEADFETEVLKSAMPVLVAFWSPWSRPCEVLKPVLGEVSAACAGSVKVVNINADNNPTLSLGCDIQSIPTLLYFVAGRERARIVGTATKEAILSQLKPVPASA